MAAPDLRAAVRHGAAHLETMAEELERLEHSGHAGGTRYADLQHRFEILGRLHARPAGRLGPVRARVRARRVAAPADGPVRRPADPRRPRAPRRRGPGPAAARRAHQPPRHQRHRVARGAPAPPLGRPARRLPRPRVPRRHRVPRLGAPRPAPDACSAATTAPTTASASSATCAPRRRPRASPDAIEREVELVQRYRSQRKHAKMHEHEARLEKLKDREGRGAPQELADAPAPRGRARRRARCARASS